MIPIFIGFDPREEIAFDVLAYSIRAKSSRPVSIEPIALDRLKGVLTRPRDPKQSTDFSFSRFLTPYLSGFEGWSLYADCDMLFFDDVAKLWALRDERFAVMAVKHDYESKVVTKHFSSRQTRYEKKNWSSLMLFNNALCLALMPDYVNTASGLELHQFKWLENKELVGDLPLRWNYLVGEYPFDPDVSNIHFTNGGPYLDECRTCDYAADWFTAEKAAAGHRRCGSP